MTQIPAIAHQNEQNSLSRRQAQNHNPQIGETDDRTKKQSTNNKKVFQSKLSLKSLNQSMRIVQQTNQMSDEDFEQKYRSNLYFKSRIDSHFRAFENRLESLRQFQIGQESIQNSGRTLITERVYKGIQIKQIYEKWKKIIGFQRAKTL